jgi:RNA polymerase sigma-70 factor (ECF subfamily)
VGTSPKLGSESVQVTGAPQRIHIPDATASQQRTAEGSPRRVIYLTRRDDQPSAPNREQVAELVRRAQRNDRDAFGQLYRVYYRPIYTLARFYLPQQAEDIVAETFLRAWGAIDRYRDMGRPFAAWLYAIARHIVADELKAKRRTEPRDELPDETREWDQDDRLVLAMGLARLSKTQRVVVELKYLVGLSHKEIAVILRKSVGAVKALRWRALQNLALYMADR